MISPNPSRSKATVMKMIASGERAFIGARLYNMRPDSRAPHPSAGDDPHAQEKKDDGTAEATARARIHHQGRRRAREGTLREPRPGGQHARRLRPRLRFRPGER